MDERDNKSKKIHADTNQRIKELEARVKSLERESRAKTEFTANLIHDIRSPLVGIAGLANHLAQDSEKHKEKQYAQVIFDGSNQLLDLINNVLDSGQKDFMEDKAVVARRFNLSELIEKLKELEEPSVLEHNLLLEVDIDSRIPESLLGDKLKLERILLNLVSNAVKFTKEGRISIHIRLLCMTDDTAKIEFLVSDTGIGIAEKKQAEVFKRYFKVNAAGKPNYKGNGLGLDIVQRYVRLLGGEVDLKSKVGEGTVFSFVLAMKRDNIDSDNPKLPKIKEQKAVTTLGNEEKPNKMPRLLLVEDNRMVLMSMKLMMEKLGIELKTAVTTSAAMEAMNKERFDMIITDIELPDGTGYGLSKSIRSLEREQDQKPKKIIGLTGHSVTEIINLCKNAGMDDVYQKPMDIQLLKLLIARAMKEKGRNTNQEKRISNG